jgi:hypothetical protein
MSFVALDIATDTGVAVWYPDSDLGRPLLSTIRCPSDPEEVARPMEKLRVALADIHTMDPITHLFFEAAILPNPVINEDGRAVQRTNIKTVYKLCSLAGMTEWFAGRVGAQCRQVEQQKWRKHFIGRGTGPTAELKRMAKEAARMRGWAPQNDHEADAAGVLDYGLACFNIRAPWRDAHLLGGLSVREGRL